MASPGNQQCANCIGTLSFPVFKSRLWECSNEAFIGLRCVPKTSF